MTAATGSLSADYPSKMFYTSYGVSDEVAKVAAEANDLFEYIARANVAYGLLNEIQEAIDLAAASAAQANWDGEDGRPVNRGTVTLAKRFVAALPSEIAIPDVYAESRGELTFEWRAGKGHIVVVSVYPNGTIGYASLIGTSKASGNESFVSSVPSALVQRIAKLYS